MKKLYLISSLFVVLMMASCMGGSSKSGPKDIADKFLKAYLQVNIDEARKYVAKDLKEDFPESRQMNEYEKQFVKIMKAHSSSHGYRFELDPLDSDIDDDEADLYYMVTAKANPGFMGEANIELEKGIDGNWYVTYYDIDYDDSALDLDY